MKNLILLSAMFLFFCTIMSCSKNEGATGPAGAEGPQGLSGATGATGAMNVVVENFTLAPTDFTEYGTAGQASDRYSATENIPAVTQDVFDNGMVLLYYAGFGSDSSWFSLPQTIYDNNATYTLTYGYNVGDIFVQRYDANLTSQQPSFTLQIKAVIIPSMSGKTTPDINWKDYKAVKAYFHLPN